MALRFIDAGGRSYGAVGASNVTLLSYWTGTNGGWAVQAGGSRITGSCLRSPSWNATGLWKNIDTLSQTAGIALACRINSGLPNSMGTLFGFLDGTGLQVELRTSNDGYLRVTRNGTIIATSAMVVSPNVYNHYEMKVKIDPSVGTVEVRLNSVPVIGPLTGLNTRGTTTSNVNGMFIGSWNSISGYSVDYDDIIMWDSVATDANGMTDVSDWIGDCRVECLFPSSAGNASQFTPDSAGANYTKVSEVTPDITSYVESGTVGHVDLYHIPDLPANVSSVKGVAAIYYARKTDIGRRGIKSVLQSAGGNLTHASEFNLADGYTYNFCGFGQNPNNASPIPWTAAGVNQLQMGQIVSA